jgi:hypothetical protein
MNWHVVSITRPTEDTVTIGVRRNGQVTEYELTVEPTSVALLVQYDNRFHLDFYDNVEARMAMCELARRAYRGEEIHLPMELPAAQVET